MTKTLNPSQLKKLSAVVLSVAKTKTAIPILNSVKFSKNGTVSAYNLQQMITVPMFFIGHIKEDFMLDADLVKRMILPEKAFTPIELNGEKAITGTAELPTIPIVDYPNAIEQGPDVAGTDYIGDITGTMIDQMVRSSAFTSKDELRPILQGILIDDEKIVATDAHRLIFIDTDCALDVPIVFPKNVVTMLGQIKSCGITSEWTVHGIFTEQAANRYQKDVKDRAKAIEKNPHKEQTLPKVMMEYIGVVLKNREYGITLSTRIIEGKYPNYRGVIPSDNNYEFKMLKSVLLHRLNEVKPGWDKKVKRCRIVIGTDNWTLYGESIDEGISIKAELPVILTTLPSKEKNEKGEEVNTIIPLPDSSKEFAVNGEYLATCLNALPPLNEDIVTIRYHSPARAFLIGNEMLLMPVMIEK